MALDSWIYGEHLSSSHPQKSDRSWLGMLVPCMAVTEERSPCDACVPLSTAPWFSIKRGVQTAEGCDWWGFKHTLLNSLDDGLTRLLVGCPRS